MLAAILLCGTTVLEPGARGFTRGVLHDEWSETVIGSDALSMYEFRRAVEASQIPHFDGVFMHSCLMGNMESLADLYPKCNGDINLLDNKEFGNLLPICKKLSSRLLTLYPDKKTEINKAIENDIYVGHPDYIFVDLQYYADQMAKATDDAELKTIADELKAQMKKTILAANNYHHSPYAKDIKPDFTLSVVAVDHDGYIGDAGLTHSFQTAYEYTNFHKQTGWGDWLNKLEAKPTTDNPAGDKKSE